MLSHEVVYLVKEQRSVPLNYTNQKAGNQIQRLDSDDPRYKDIYEDVTGYIDQKQYEKVMMIRETVDVTPQLPIKTRSRRQVLVEVNKNLANISIRPPLDNIQPKVTMDENVIYAVGRIKNFGIGKFFSAEGFLIKRRKNTIGNSTNQKTFATV
ncbi:MAG: hypothetical protein E6H10_19080 [Bacteroidetes bacterium]|nr:MAG: hypothetical protein E6H10_19080 [Bacteroidota bacterium]